MVQDERGSAHTAPVLLVDDMEFDLLLTRNLLARIDPGMTVETMKDSEKVLDYLIAKCQQQEPMPRLVLLDIKMPRVDGFELLAAIRSDARFNSLPVVMYSSSGEPQDRERAQSLGATDFAVKSTDGKDLQRVVTSTLVR